MTTLALPGALKKVRTADALVIPQGTTFVRRDLLRVSQEIERLWPNLRVVRCSKAHDCVRDGHYPFLVVEKGRDGKTHPVFGTIELDGRVLKRLWNAHREQNPFDAMVKRNAATARAKAQREQEARAERLEVIGGALRSHKHDYRADSLGMRTTG